MFKDNEIHTKVDTLQTNVDKIGKQNQATSELIEKLQKQVSVDITQLQGMVGQFSVGFAVEVQNIKTELTAVKQAREDVEKSTRSFAEVQKKIERTIHEQLSTAIAESIQKLKLDAENYNSLKSEIVKTSTHVQKLTNEVDKFSAISSQIKQADFELSKHARNLKAGDDERIRLLKQIDDLQRMIAKMRRSQQ
ncbi:MAG TPA: hypothetical protein VJK72_06055 [Candidatus Nanoarchaeia archaeon]|nr:hypothetical protein [Candidatus Nanoarchaeia archaeon]